MCLFAYVDICPLCKKPKVMFNMCHKATVNDTLPESCPDLSEDSASFVSPERCPGQVCYSCDQGAYAKVAKLSRTVSLGAVSSALNAASLVVALGTGNAYMAVTNSVAGGASAIAAYLSYSKQTEVASAVNASRSRS